MNLPNQPSSLSSQRAEQIRLFSEKPLDLLVVGGGIVGSGIARDAAMRGLRTGLVEQYDFAFGTSSRSSRLLHGGMRYLAQGRFGLVREGSIEKNIIHHIAPHLAQPLPFIFPSYQGNRHWVLWQLKLGVKIYDLLCGGRNLGSSSWIGPSELKRFLPDLQATGLKGAVRYFDGFTNDSRLVIDTLRSASRSGALLLNYCRFKTAQRSAHWSCEVEDTLTANSFVIEARAVVNATGPWADRLPHSRVKLRVTKGVHLVVHQTRIPVSQTVVMTEGKRILFAIPWGERVILGTTDTDYSGPLDQLHANHEEIRYLLNITNQFFPSARLEDKDVISSWAGLRPLIANLHGKPSDISRTHEIRNPEPFWFDIAGGKLTTYRLMAEQATDAIVLALTKHQKSARTSHPCRTAKEPLLPIIETDGISGILPPQFSQKLVSHYCRNEWAVHLDDVMVRRTSWRQYCPDSFLMAQQAADWMTEIFNWSKSEREEELARYERNWGDAGKENRLPAK